MWNQPLESECDITNMLFQVQKVLNDFENNTKKEFAKRLLYIESEELMDELMRIAKI